MKVAVILVSLLFLIGFISASGENLIEPSGFGFDNLNGPTLVPAINYSELPTVNQSDWWITPSLGPLTDAAPGQFTTFGDNTLYIDSDYIDANWLSLDGTNSPSANINWNNKSILNLNSIFFKDNKHLITTSQIDGGDAIVFENGDSLIAGGISFINIANDSDGKNVVTQWDQIGANFSFSGQMNSFGPVSKEYLFWVEDQVGAVLQQDDLNVMFNVSNYPYYCEFLQTVKNEVPEGCKYFADTSGQGGPLLHGFNLEIHSDAVIHGGLTVYDAFQYIDRNTNDAEFLWTNGSEAKLHIRDTRTIEANISFFEKLITNFDNGVIFPFSSESIAPETGRDWGVSVIPQAECFDDLCADAQGGNEKIMSFSQGTTFAGGSVPAENITLSFYVSSDFIVGDTFEVELNDNQGNVTTIYTLGVDTLVTPIAVQFPTLYENKSNVTTRFIFNGANINSRVWVDEIFVNATPSSPIIINETYFGGKETFGQDTNELDECYIEMDKIINNNTQLTEPRLTIKCNNVNLQGNVTQTSVTEVEVNVTDNVTASNFIARENFYLDGQKINDTFFRVDGNSVMDENANFGNNSIYNASNINATGLGAFNELLIDASSPVLTFGDGLAGIEGIMSYDAPFTRFYLDQPLILDDIIARSQVFNVVADTTGSGTYIRGLEANFGTGVFTFGDMDNGAGNSATYVLNAVTPLSTFNHDVDITGDLDVGESQTIQENLTVEDFYVCPQKPAELGSELITAPSFDSSSGWDLGTNWTISGGNANHTFGTSNLTSDAIIDSGETYKLTYTIDDVQGNGNATICVGGVCDTTRTSAGSFEVASLTTTNTNNLTITGRGSTTLGSELVTNSDFLSSLTPWQQTGSVWAHFGSDAYWTDTDFDTLYQTIDIVNGQDYEISIDVSVADGSSDGSWLDVFLGGTLAGTITDGETGVNNFTVTAGSNGKIEIVPSPGFGSSDSYWLGSVSVKEIIDPLVSLSEISLKNITRAGGKICDFDGALYGDSFNVVSDENLKENINLIDNSSSRRLYEYDLIGNPNYKKSIGLLSSEAPQECVYDIMGKENIDLYCLASMSYVEAGKKNDEKEKFDKNIKLKDNLTEFTTDVLAEKYHTNTTRDTETMTKISNFRDTLEQKTFQQVIDFVLDGEGKLSNNILFNTEQSEYGSYELGAIGHFNRAMIIFLMKENLNQKEELDTIKECANNNLNYADYRICVGSP